MTSYNDNSEISQLYSPAKSYWNQHHRLLERRKRLTAMSRAVDRPGDLYLYQWAQLFTFALEFEPDFILELGRGLGNSTCVFTEVANILKPRSCKVLSLCRSNHWYSETTPKLRKVVEQSWFEPLEALQGDILKFDFKSRMSDHNRIFIFWDAHGYDVAERVLGYILPLIVDRPHILAVHDLSDIRYVDAPKGDYHLWKGENNIGALFRLGHVYSNVEEAISVIDFAQRNCMVLHSADYSMHEELSADQVKELNKILGADFFSQTCHWFWFSLNEIPGPYSFPISPEIPIDRTSKIAAMFSALLKRIASRIEGRT